MKESEILSSVSGSRAFDRRNLRQIADVFTDTKSNKSKARARREESFPFQVPRCKGEERMKKETRRNRKRGLEELNVMDDFLMNAAASDPKGGAEFCRLLLSALLEREIGKVEVNIQKMIPAYTPGLRGIRMDVEVIEETEPILNLYDIEPCLYYSEEENLAKRNRFYQGRIDGRYMQSGERNFSRLPNIYVIVILPYDPFGEDYMMYRFRTKCEELPELDYPDGLRYIYLNTKGNRGGSPQLRQLLDYLEESTEENVKGELLQRIHRHVERVKLSPEVREEYMRFEDIIYYERKEADLSRGRADILELLGDYGTPSAELKERIEEEKEPEILKRWLRLAARCGSLAAFEKQMYE